MKNEKRGALVGAYRIRPSTYPVFVGANNHSPYTYPAARGANTIINEYTPQAA